MTDRPTTNCKNCKTEVNFNYCHHCGQPVILKRINGHYIIHEVEHVLHFEKGILYTIRELLIRPGENVKQFISENRSRLVKPIIFIIITSLAYSLINHYFHLEDGYVNYSEQQQSTTGIFFKWVQAYYGYSNIIMGIFIAFWIKLFFRKYNYFLKILPITLKLKVRQLLARRVSDGKYLDGAIIEREYQLQQFYHDLKLQSYLPPARY